MQSHRLADGRDVLDFAAPILFQSKDDRRRSTSGIYQAPLTAVANLVLVLLGDPDARHQSRPAPSAATCSRGASPAPIRVLRNSLQELAKGRYDYRIAETRTDEFGELYAAFDKTAAALEAAP